MAGVAGNQNEFIGQGDGGDFEIGKGERGSRLFQLGADSAADKGGLAVETKREAGRVCLPEKSAGARTLVVDRLKLF
jgi:hypothetical protein